MYSSLHQAKVDRLNAAIMAYKAAKDAGLIERVNFKQDERPDI